MTKSRNLTPVVMAAMLLTAWSVQATSHVRIVRLSYESGHVQMDRSTGQGLERAMLNSPVIEGSRVVTGADGLAEVEFENNSSVRLGEASEAKFRQLLINDAGDKVNEVELVSGTLYFDTRSSKNDIYRVIAADQTFVISRNSQVRFQTSGNQVQAAVLNGGAQLESGAQPTNIKKNDTLTVDSANPQGFVIAKSVEKLPLDRWNSERAAYQTAYSYSNDPYGSKSLSAFGYQDLAYYGGFMSVSGYGTVWQPYGASSWMGWDPYSTGAWAFTPGLGYVWASAYPWGWLPYHYGAWAFQPTIGWFWYPGSSFNGGGVVNNWQGNAPIVNAPVGYKPPTPPTVPTTGPRPAVLVGRVGRAPAYLPGGVVPPDFRSVITDHSSLAGTKGPAGNTNATSGSTATGSSFAHNSRSTNMSGGAGHNGHVFAPPPSAASSWPAFSNPEGFGSGASTGVGHSSGVPTQSTGGTHASSTTAGHSSGQVTPK